MNLPQIQKIMMEFEKQNEMMGAPVPRSSPGLAGTLPRVR